MSQRRVQRGQLLTPYPQYPGVSFAAPGWGNSNYHALQAKLTKRFDSGDTVVVAYTFSKLISDGGDNAWDSALWRDYYCRSCDKSLSPYDQPQRLVTSFTYALPFGKGQKFGSSWNGALNAILGNWQTNGILTFNSGLVQQFAVPSNTSFSFGGGQRPDSTGVDPRLDSPHIDRWFDTDQLLIPQPYTFGNVARVHPTVRTDGIQQLDFSVFKDVPITERVKAQFRAGWFNFTNTPIFNNPAATVGAGSFGRVTSQANSPRHPSSRSRSSSEDERLKGRGVIRRARFSGGTPQGPVGSCGARYGSSSSIFQSWIETQSSCRMPPVSPELGFRLQYVHE